MQLQPLKKCIEGHAPLLAQCPGRRNRQAPPSCTMLTHPPTLCLCPTTPGAALPLYPLKTPTSPGAALPPHPAPMPPQDPHLVQQAHVNEYGGHGRVL